MDLFRATARRNGRIVADLTGNEESSKRAYLDLMDNPDFRDCEIERTRDGVKLESVGPSLKKSYD